MDKLRKFYPDFHNVFFWSSITYAFFGVVFNLTLDYSQGCFITLLTTLLSSLFFAYIDCSGVDSRMGHW